MDIFLSGFAFGLGPQELMIVLVIVLLFFGGAKIPQLMRGLGKGMGEFQEGIKDGKKNYDAAINDMKNSTSSEDEEAASTEKTSTQNG